ncbi:MAG: SBBP repeat-containing protein [Chitinophagales bacterium]|nr:SBBP repeat-containing protein [Chitinophagales bacterium]
MNNITKRRSLFLVVFFSFFIQNLQAQPINFSWAKRIGDIGFDHCNNFCMDASGNILSTGYFEYTVDFDPGGGTANLTASNWDIFITKMDAAGNLLWAKKMGGPLSDIGRSITTDASENIYITGRFSDTADFDPGPGTFKMHTEFANSFEGFIVKLNSSGGFVWAKKFRQSDSGFYNTIFPYFIKTDKNGNIYSCGYFGETYDFDPGPDSLILSATPNKKYDMYFSKLDSAGNFVWAKRVGGSFYDIPNALTVDDMGNIYATGYFQDIVDFDPGSAVFSMTAPVADGNAFILKLNSAGDFIFAKQLNSTSSSLGSSITTDAKRNIYSIGIFYSNIDMDPGPGTTTFSSVNNTYDMYLSKLDSSGNFVFAKQILKGNGNSWSSDINSMALDSSGNIYVTGVFNGTADFNPGVDSFKLTAVSNRDIFFSKMDSNGNFILANRIGGTDIEYSTSLIVSPSRDIYISGYFKGTTDFNPGSGTNNLVSSGGSEDIFILKLNQSVSTGLMKYENLATFTVYPNPSSNRFFIRLDNNYYDIQLKIYDINGKEVYAAEYDEGYLLEVELKEAPGMYFLSVMTRNKQGLVKLIKSQ